MVNDFALRFFAAEFFVFGVLTGNFAIWYENTKELNINLCFEGPLNLPWRNYRPTPEFLRTQQALVSAAASKEVGLEASVNWYFSKSRSNS